MENHHRKTWYYNYTLNEFLADKSDKTGSMLNTIAQRISVGETKALPMSMFDFKISVARLD